MTTSTALAVALDADVPVILWGPPGGGKTAAVESLAAARGWHCEVLLGATLDPVDVAGRPLVAGGIEAPEFLRRIRTALIDGAKGVILFLDELSCAPPLVQAALLTLIQSRTAGGFMLPAEVRIVAAANPPRLAAGGQDLPAPSANRLVHLPWEVDPQAWSRGIIDAWGKGAHFGWRSTPAGRQAAMVIAAFVMARPALLLAVPESEADQGGGWPSPRSWENAARLLAAAAPADGGRIDPTLAAILVDGCVGAGAGREFRGWLREARLPDPAAVRRDPEGIVYPHRGDLVFALAQAVAAGAGASVDAWQGALKFLARLAREEFADAAASACRTLGGCKPAGAKLDLRDATAFAALLRAAGLVR